METNVTDLKPELAPRPTRKSLARSLYDALVSLNGPAPVDQIREMLPATDDAEKWSTATPARIEGILKTTVYQGYVMPDAVPGRWRIGTRQFYDLAQAHIREGALEREHRRLDELTDLATVDSQLEIGMPSQPWSQPKIIWFAIGVSAVGWLIFGLSAIGVYTLLGGA